MRLALQQGMRGSGTQSRESLFPGPVPTGSTHELRGTGTQSCVGHTTFGTTQTGSEVRHPILSGPLTEVYLAFLPYLVTTKQVASYQGLLSHCFRVRDWLGWTFQDQPLYRCGN